MDLNHWHIFRVIAAELPDREALIQGERRFTYAQLADRTSRLANALRSLGLGARTPRSELAPWQVGQDRVALLMHNCPEYAEGLLGGFAARVAPFNVNYSYVPDELAYLFDDADASAVVYQARFAPRLAKTLPLLRRRPLLIQIADSSGEPLLPGAVDYESALAAADPTAPADQSPDDIKLLYTGGTTGMPKGVIWRQGSLWQSMLARGRHRQGVTLETLTRDAAARPGSRSLVCAPMMHGGGALNALGSLVYGDTIAFPANTERLDPAEVWRTIERERGEAMLIVGEAFARPLLKELSTGGYDTSSLRMLLTGGAPVSRQTKDTVARDLPHVTLYELMGASETGGALQRTDRSGEKRLDPGVFRPRPGADVTVVSADRTHREAPGHPDSGWLAVAGNIPLGYLGDRTKTEATFATVDGTRWSVPGDRALLRADGLIEI
ncbi:AMP-binding protein, partial [Streptomyces sp. NPDC055078]